MKNLLQNLLLNIDTESRNRAAAGMALAAALIAVPGIANAGEPPQSASTICAGCHGADGKGMAPMFPNLAGLQSVYLKKQLNDFIDGRRKNDIMSPVASTIKSDEIDQLADYYSSLKPASAGAADAALVEKGSIFFQEGNPDTGVPGCVGCHMDEGVGSKQYPRLAGQSATYIVQQLTNFKSGARNNDNGSLMRSVAKEMTEQEMAAVAEYLASLK